MSVYDEIRLAVFRQLHTRDDGCWDVTACRPPDMAVWVGEHVLVLPPAHAAFPRIDLIGVDSDGRTVRVIAGTAAPVSLQPDLPEGCKLMARLRVSCSVRAISDSMIERVPSGVQS